MKNAKISSEPLWSWCSGIASGSPSQSARATSRTPCGAQQQAEGKAGDQRRAQVDRRQAPDARAQRLHGERSQDGERAVERPRAEIEKHDIEAEQGRERGDLEVARVAGEKGPDPARPG